jgi:hypothetical protein
MQRFNDDSVKCLVEMCKKNPNPSGKVYGTRSRMIENITLAITKLNHGNNVDVLIMNPSELNNFWCALSVDNKLFDNMCKASLLFGRKLEDRSWLVLSKNMPVGEYMIVTQCPFFVDSKNSWPENNDYILVTIV